MRLSGTALGTGSSTKRCQRGFSVTILRVLPDHVVTVACAKPKPVIAARFPSEAGGDRCGLPGNYLVEVRGVVRWIVCSVCSHALMLPLHEAIRFREVELLLIATAGVVCVAAVAVAHDQRFQVRWKLSAQRFLVRSPDFVDDVTQILCDKRIAVRMDLVRRVADLDARPWVSRLRESRGKRKIEFSELRTFECFEGSGILPIEFGYPQVTRSLCRTAECPRGSHCPFSSNRNDPV